MGTTSAICLAVLSIPTNPGVTKASELLDFGSCGGAWWMKSKCWNILAFNESWFPHCACLSCEKKHIVTCHFFALFRDQDFRMISNTFQGRVSRKVGIQWVSSGYQVKNIRNVDLLEATCTPLGSPSGGSWWCNLLPACSHLGTEMA